MLTKRITLFRLFGFPIMVDATWIFLAALVTWSLAQGLFPEYYPDFSDSTYWWMGVGGAFGLFVSIILHELGHALVARRYGINIKDITLFIFGGLANMEDEPPSAKSEFWMAIAGPIASVLLAGLLYVVHLAGAGAGGETLAAPFAVIEYLSWINGILALFNIFPAFPLDGGRMLRAALWSWKNDMKWATGIASGMGSLFGITLIVLGFLSFVAGQPVGGLWWIMIGLFVRAASQAAYNQVIIRKALHGEPVSRFMKIEPVTVSPDTTLADLVEDYIYRHHFKMLPVTENGTLKGCVTTQDVKSVSRDEWQSTRVADILKECTEENSIAPDADAMKALEMMNQSGQSRLMVVENGNLSGVIALKDLLGYLTLKTDLEGEEG